MNHIWWYSGDCFKVRSDEHGSVSSYPKSFKFMQRTFVVDSVK